jgi:diguanylate cyclase (GGDEF)-like protein
MVRQALADKKPVVANDSQNDPRVAHRQQHVQFSTFSMAILPLVIADTAVGVFALYSREKEFFHDEEMKLLTDVTGDIAFAVDHLEKQARLDYLAYYDVLTELANRTLFVERLNLHLRGVAGHGKKIALFVIDLERFRNFNDSLGRSEGDALLKHVAHFLTRHFGDANLVARIGGDQFAVAIPELLDSESIDVLADKLLAAVLKSPFIKDDIEHRFSVKVGGAQLPGDGNTAEKALQNAEAALKKAKTVGERFLTFASSMTAAVSTRLNLENRLRKAVDQDEFVLHYQPKIELLNGKLAGVEALIRWNDPQTGLVPPGQFIPVLEETGLMYEVGRWVIQKAIADFISWRAKGLRPVRIAVNVSPLQLRKRDFVADVESRIRLEPLAADGLELEITESMIMEDVHNTIDKLKAICALGVHIAIDDFGTGYSSLSYLSKLPVNTLKIDRSFVHEMTNSAQGMALVSTIINLARSLRLKVVAEGVETDQQAQMLRLLGCDEVQGFLYSKPVPSEVFESNFLNVTA